MKFKVGDIVKGIRNNSYGITNHRMTRAEVISADDYDMKVKILEHDRSNRVGEKYTVDNSDTEFELVCSATESIVTVL